MSRLRSHSRASSRGSDFYDGAVSFNQDDGSFADQSEDDEVMKVPQRVRCHSLSRLDTLQNKCRLQFEEPFVESKQVADFNVEQLLMQLQDHRATLDAVNPELFKKVHSTGVYFISVDVQVPPLSAAARPSASLNLRRTAAVLWRACSKFLPWQRAFPLFLPDGQLNVCQVCAHFSLALLTSRLTPAAHAPSRITTAASLSSSASALAAPISPPTTCP